MTTVAMYQMYHVTQLFPMGCRYLLPCEVVWKMIPLAAAPSKHSMVACFVVYCREKLNVNSDNTEPHDQYGEFRFLQ